MLGAVAKAAVKKGASAVKGAAKSRARKAGDIATNARKRYYRSAERNLKKAEQSAGATASRYRALARQDFEDALSTYDSGTTQHYSKPIQRLANEFGYDLESGRKNRLSGDSQRRREIIARSEQAKESSLSDINVRREREARSILNNTKLGRRIMGGTVDIWRDAATYIDEYENLKIDSTKIMPALFEYFEVDNVADLVDKIEEIAGEDLYADDESDRKYENVKLTLQTYVAENALVA